MCHGLPPNTHHKHVQVLHSLFEPCFAIRHHHFCFFFHPFLLIKIDASSGVGKTRQGRDIEMHATYLLLKVMHVLSLRVIPAFPPRN